MNKSITIVSIFGKIEGNRGSSQGGVQSEEKVLELLRSEIDPDIKGIIVLINSGGGEVNAGLSIAEAISSLSKPTASIVIGKAGSMAVAVAVSAKRTFIVPSGYLMEHPTTSNIQCSKQGIKHLKMMNKRVINFIVDHSNISKKTLKKISNARNTDSGTGTDILAEKAVEIGLIDRIGGIKEAIAALNEMSKN